jgi:hypothetical protein
MLNNNSRSNVSETEDSDKCDTNKLRLQSLSDYSVKAELYVVSLTFSILALSIQFPVDSTELLVLRLQAAGWILLVLSGIAGIQLLRNVTREYSLVLTEYGFKCKAILSKRHFDKTNLEIVAEVFSEWISEVKGQRKWLSPIQGYGLVSGLLFLLSARIAAFPIF